jgi:hypothetical protein
VAACQGVSAVAGVCLVAHAATAQAPGLSAAAVQRAEALEEVLVTAQKRYRFPRRRRLARRGSTTSLSAPSGMYRLLILLGLRVGRLLSGLRTSRLRTIRWAVTVSALPSPRSSISVSRSPPRREKERAASAR